MVVVFECGAVPPADLGGRLIGGLQKTRNRMVGVMGGCELLRRAIDFTAAAIDEAESAAPGAMYAQQRGRARLVVG